MITIELNDDAVEAALNRLFAGMSDLSEPMNEIGMTLVQSTEARFAAEVAPDGAAWAARSAVTIQRYLAQGRTFDGILHRSGQLGGTISHDYGPDFVEVASDRPYAAMMQFGGARAQFPHLWGDIPARPFLGLSAADEVDILDIVVEWMTGLAASGGA